MLEEGALSDDVFPLLTGTLWTVTPDPFRDLDEVDTFGVDADFPIG